MNMKTKTALANMLNNRLGSAAAAAAANLNTSTGSAAGAVGCAIMANHQQSQSLGQAGSLQAVPDQQMQGSVTTGQAQGTTSPMASQIIQQSPVIVAGGIVRPQTPAATPQRQQQISMLQQQQLSTNNVLSVNNQTSGVEPSAAGTLRLMTQQHNAALQQPPNQISAVAAAAAAAAAANSGGTVSGAVGVGAGVSRVPHDLMLLQQKQQQMRRPILQAQMSTNHDVVSTTTGNVGGDIIGPAGGNNNSTQQQQQPQQQHVIQQQLLVSSSGTCLNNSGGGNASMNQSQILNTSGGVGAGGLSGVVMHQSGINYLQANRITQLPLPTRSQFYGHNPNLKLPSEMFLVGCTFYIVEEQDDDKNDERMMSCIKAIRYYGGDIEKVYCPRVSHVLCRTQRHGIVMQALRDAKRCVTAYWLNDICLKRQLLPPWQPLHLPFPSQFGYQKPLEKHIITSNGYNYEEEYRLKQMVQECGAVYTTYLCKFNTVLITKRLEGVFFTTAMEWNIPTVNTTWLNDIAIGNLSNMLHYECPKYQQYNITNTPFRIDYNLVPHLMGKI